MKCTFYKVPFPDWTILYWVVNAQQVYFGCPVCQDIHMYCASLDTAEGEIVVTCGQPEDETTGDEPVVTLETVK